VAVVALPMALAGCSASERVASTDTLAGGAESIYPAPVARGGARPADVVLDWMDLHTDLLQREGLGPPIASRFIGYASLTLAEAVRLGTPGSGLLPVPGLELPGSPSEPVDPSVVAAVATATVTRSFIPGLEAQRSVGLLEAQQVEQARARDEAAIEASVSLGTAVGQAVLALAAADGYDSLPQRFEGDLPQGAGLWVPTPPGNEFPLEPYWGTLRPLVVAESDCPVPPPVRYDEMPDSAFRDEAMAVVDAVADLSDEQRSTVLYWRDRPSTSYTPIGHWVRIASGVIESGDGAPGMTLVDAATAYAALGIAGYDSFIATWAQKYATNVLRPITYLHAQFDPAWRPTITTPPFPSYPSGHSSGSTAAAAVLGFLLGERPFTDTAGAFEGHPPRNFPSFMAAAEEASQSRLWAGIHFPMDLAAGMVQGECVGTLALSRLGLTAPLSY
jgi:membrane-associated phospholipid phosphatase